MEEEIRLIVQGDDFGMCHSVNLAFQACMEYAEYSEYPRGILTTASIMVPPPWFEEAAEICAAHPQFSIGLHLTLTSEWHPYRWKPVLPRTEVPTLVDSHGYFWYSNQQFLDAKPSLDQVEKELRAQIDIALDRGIDLSNLATHMGTARLTPELQEIVDRLSKDYKIPQIMHCGEKPGPNIYPVPPSEKLSFFLNALENLKPGLWLMVFHLGLDTSEMKAIKEPGAPSLVGWSVADHRSAETRALISFEAYEVVRRRNIKLVGYREIRDELRKHTRTHQNMKINTNKAR